MVRTARNVKKGKGILGIPDSIDRHGLSDEILARVKSFCEDDQIRGICAGEKDFLTVKNSDGTKERHQKKKKFFAILENHSFNINQHSLMAKQDFQSLLNYDLNGVQQLIKVVLLMYIPSECQVNAIRCQSNIEVPSIT